DVCSSDLKSKPASGSSARAEMHPSVNKLTRALDWFLRTRGDAPGSANPKHLLTGVPPHARRCTPAAGLRPNDRRGSSARAEMHPTTCRSDLRTTGFLRTRGDAPNRRRSLGESQ